MNVPTEALLAVLREIAADVHALREAAEDSRAPPPLRHKDRAALEKILPVLAANFGDSTFATWELVDAARANDATGANLRIVLGTLTAQQLGKLFQRASGKHVDGLALHRVGSSANGVLWRCTVNVSPFAARR